jgi:hypothetical protein
VYISDCIKWRAWSVEDRQNTVRVYTGNRFNVVSRSSPPNSFFNLERPGIRLSRSDAVFDAKFQGGKTSIRPQNAFRRIYIFNRSAKRETAPDSGKTPIQLIKNPTRTLIAETSTCHQGLRPLCNRNKIPIFYFFSPVLKLRGNGISLLLSKGDRRCSITS